MMTGLENVLSCPGYFRPRLVCVCVCVCVCCVLEGSSILWENPLPICPHGTQTGLEKWSQSGTKNFPKVFSSCKGNQSIYLVTKGKDAAKRPLLAPQTNMQESRICIKQQKSKGKTVASTGSSINYKKEQGYFVVFYNNGSSGADSRFYYSCFMSYKLQQTIPFSVQHRKLLA